MAHDLAMDDLAARWRTAWGELHAAAPAGLFEELVQRHAESRRAYHTMTHLTECFAQMTALRDACERPAEVEIALWFHDAIYDTQRYDSEERSAQWAEHAVRAVSTTAVAARIRDLVLATKNESIPSTTDAKVILDVDLWVLGAPVERFDQFEAQVRREYGWLPEDGYREARGKVLGELLARPSIYSTPRFRAQHEAAARANLARSLARLDADP
jgi:predicted metal-dependent HD superfamily phosphohydrolase